MSSKLPVFNWRVIQTPTAKWGATKVNPLLAVLLMAASLFSVAATAASKPPPKATAVNNAGSIHKDKKDASNNPLLAEGVELIASQPHPKKAFTQGLEFSQGKLYESSGLYGRSYVVKEAHTSAAVYRRLPKELFAEGLTVVADQLYLITWQAGIGLVLNTKSMQVERRFSYEGEGWGLCNNGEQLILSDGSANLRFYSLDKFQLQGRLAVHYQGKPLDKLNELEYHDGLIWANRWYDNGIYAIEPSNGEVIQRFDLSELRRRVDNPHAVLNGIAYDPVQGNWLVTGKLWPQMYRLNLNLDLRDHRQ